MSSAAELIDPDAGMWQWLAYELRFQRERARKSQTEVAELTGYSRKAVSHWEAGRSKPPVESLEKLDEAWNTGGLLVRIHHYATTVQAPGTFMTFAEYEAQATMIEVSALAWLPGLLQMPEYAEEAFRAAGAPDVETEVASRLARQEIFKRSEPPFLTALIHEAVLLVDLPPEIWQGQFERLLELSELRHVVLRLVPLSAGLHVGLDGAFSIFSTPDREVAFVETSARGRLVIEPEDLRRLRVSFHRISAVALSPDATRAKLREMIERPRQ